MDTGGRRQSHSPWPHAWVFMGCLRRLGAYLGASGNLFYESPFIHAEYAANYGSDKPKIIKHLGQLFGAGLLLYGGLVSGGAKSDRYGRLGLAGGWVWTALFYRLVVTFLFQFFN